MDSVFESARVWQYITLPRLAIRQSDVGVLSKVFEYFTQSQLKYSCPRAVLQNMISAYGAITCIVVSMLVLFSLFDPTQIPNFVAV